MKAAESGGFDIAAYLLACGASTVRNKDSRDPSHQRFPLTAFKVAKCCRRRGRTLLAYPCGKPSVIRPASPPPVRPTLGAVAAASERESRGVPPTCLRDAPGVGVCCLLCGKAWASSWEASAVVVRKGVARRGVLRCRSTGRPGQRMAKFLHRRRLRGDLRRLPAFSANFLLYLSLARKLDLYGQAESFLVTNF